MAGVGDVDLDRRAYRKNPPAADITATPTGLREASVEALSVFAGYQIGPGPDWPTPSPTASSNTWAARRYGNASPNG